jgi:hypothetical protein
MSDKDYGEDRHSFDPYPGVNTIFDKPSGRMIYKDGRGRAAGSFVKTMAERQKDWHERAAKDDMVLFVKNQYEGNLPEYIICPLLFEQDIELIHEFTGELSDESTAVIESMREDITGKHNAYTAHKDRDYFAALFAKRAAEDRELRECLR